MKYYVGIDLGGTNIVAGVVDEEYNIVTNSDGSIKYKLKFKLLELLGK